MSSLLERTSLSFCTSPSRNAFMAAPAMLGFPPHDMRETTQRGRERRGGRGRGRGRGRGGSEA
eukprot:745983-Hanusia_phi.AAC.4